MTVRRATSVMIGALALGLPGAAGALDTLEAEIARAAAFVEVVRANGCAITEAEAERLLPPPGLTMDDAQGAALLLNRGALFTVSEDGEALILTPELCAAEAEAAAALIAAAAQAGPRVQFLELGQRIDPAAGARLVGALRANGCAMTEDQAGAILPGLGFDPETVQDLAALLIQTGFARYDGALHLDPAACAADAGQDHDLIFTALGRLADLAGLPPATPDLTGVRAAVGLAAMRQGCVIDLEDLAATRAVLTYEVLMHYDIAEPSDEVLATIAAHIDTTLAEPGPAYAREPGRLRLTSCMP